MKWRTYEYKKYYLESSVDNVKTVLCGKKLGHAAQAHNVRMLESKPHHQLFKQVLWIQHFKSKRLLLCHPSPKTLNFYITSDLNKKQSNFKGTKSRDGYLF
jgi:hypothetical protein